MNAVLYLSPNSLYFQSKLSVMFSGPVNSLSVMACIKMLSLRNKSLEKVVGFLLGFDCLSDFCGEARDSGKVAVWFLGHEVELYNQLCPLEDTMALVS